MSLDDNTLLVERKGHSPYETRVVFDRPDRYLFDRLK